ncbi:MAG: hypothetical protein EON90_09135 [Brevundimonas sp.]|nr:MAG: hypothetical protein EON90_09135 [Brevundimonas sp.]
MRDILGQAAGFGALVFVLGACASACGVIGNAAEADLDQQWTADQRTRWREASQGSRLLPLAWLQSLEQAESQTLFLDDENIRRLGYLPSTTSHDLQLPVGFAVDRTDAARLGETNLRWKSRQERNEPWVGMNCSACHTAQLNYGEHVLRVEGGPGMGDFQSLIEGLNAALATTLQDPAKFDRFARAVLGTENREADRALLRDALSKLVRRETELARLNETPLRYGPGRVDAFGHIFNKVAYSAGAVDQVANPSDAPVSYPFLWNVPQHDRLQWNGQIDNFRLPAGGQPVDVGALGRNAGEVIGVFADVQVSPPGLTGYQSSVDVKNLIRLEQQLGSLRPPAWPTRIFPDEPDRAALVTEGRALFRARCTSCHTRLERTDLRTPIRAEFSYFNPSLSTPQGRDAHPAPGTDPWMACNAYTRTALTGVLQGTPANYFSGRRLEDEDRLSAMLVTTVVGSMVKQAPDILTTSAASAFGLEPPPEITAPVDGGLSDREIRLRECMGSASAKLGYKARPLTGIWATAPYLHNGSVRTLYQLLLPEGEREASFYVGAREFDPRDVGYVNQPGPSRFLFRAVDDAGNPIPGNSNRGHDYGNASLSERNRRALIEYMKTL